MKRYEHKAYMVNLGTDCASKMNRKKNGNYVRHDEAQAEIDTLLKALELFSGDYPWMRELIAKHRGNNG